MTNNWNDCVTEEPLKQKTMCDTISTTAPYPRPIIYGGSPTKKIEYIPEHHEKSITEPDNGHQTESPSPKLDYTIESERLKTFETWQNEIVGAADLARAGFYNLKDPTKPDLVKCAFCRAEICNWEPGDDAFLEHVKWSPNCPFVRDNSPNNPIAVEHLRREGGDVCGSGQLFLNSVPEREVFMRLSELTSRTSSLEDRLETFNNWPKHRSQQPRALAEAGFYYMGLDDHVICFSCRGALKDWIAEDDPWEQHAIWFPNCSFLLAKKGKEYVDEVQRKLRPQVPVVPSRKQTQVPVPSKNSTKEQTEESANGRNVTEEVLLCKICDSNERNVIFIPCKHILACEKCAAKLDTCPVCRKLIVERMKVYLS